MIDFTVGMGPEQGVSNLQALLANLNFWEPGVTVEKGLTVRGHAVTYNAMLYAECTTAGTTGAAEPDWPETGNTVTDGTAVWVIRDLRKPFSGEPVGIIKEYAGDTAPDGYLLCDGSAVSRTQYADLFTVIGIKFGEGDGSTTFNLPDRRGRVGVGVSNDDEFNAIGKTGGEKMHVLSVGELAAHGHSMDMQGNHSHVQTVYGAGGNTGSIPVGFRDVKYDATGGYSTRESGIHSHNIFNTGGDSAHNNLQPYLCLNYIIKT